MKAVISKEFPHLYSKIYKFSLTMYVCDYTEMTKKLAKKRDVEVHTVEIKDNVFFTITNENNIDVDTIIHDNSSFVYGKNNAARSQCEMALFPTNNDDKSWFLLIELKHSQNPNFNSKNLRKAFSQLLRTRYYYFLNGVIKETNTSYLIASLPFQSEPFPSFVLPPPLVTKFKIDKGIIIGATNSIKIIDEKNININDVI